MGIFTRRTAEENPAQAGWASGETQPETYDPQAIDALESEKRRDTVVQKDQDVPVPGYENADNPASQTGPYPTAHRHPVVACPNCNGTGRVAAQTPQVVARVVVPEGAGSVVGSPVYLSNGQDRATGRVAAFEEKGRFKVAWADGTESIESKSQYQILYQGVG